MVIGVVMVLDYFLVWELDLSLVDCFKYLVVFFVEGLLICSCIDIVCNCILGVFKIYVEVNLLCLMCVLVCDENVIGF